MAVVFEDGFETNDYSLWDGGASAEQAISSTVRFQGLYSSKTTMATSDLYLGGSDTTLVGKTTYYARCYAYVPAATLALIDTNVYQIGFSHLANATSALAFALTKIKHIDGAPRWTLTYRDGGGTADVYDAANAPTADVWHCIELKVLVDGVAGEARLYVDAAEVANATGLDNNDIGTEIDNVCIQSIAYGVDTAVWYIDNVVVNTDYNGPESPMKGVITGYAILG